MFDFFYVLLLQHINSKKTSNPKLAFNNNLTFTRNPSFYVAENMKGRKKQDFERIPDKQYRNIAFSKKKLGLFSKAEAFASDFGGKLAIIIQTECNKWHAYSLHRHKQM